MASPFEMINGTPNYNLYIAGEWTRSLRNDTTESFNPATGEYVRNAEVTLQGTARMVTTESDGTFSLPNVPSGPATLVVNYTGYDQATTTVNVSPDATARAMTRATV